MGRLRRLGLIVSVTGAVASTLHPASASTQAVPGSLVPRVERGEVVRVLDRDSRQIDGRVLDLSDATIVLERSGMRIEILHADVARLERDDPVWNGVANGLFAGALASAEASALSACVVGWHCTIGLLSAYAGLGALIDRGHRETVVGPERDSPWDGGLKGLAIGLPVGMFNNNCDRARAWVCVGQVAAAYAAVGLILDVAHAPRPSSATSSVVPLVSSGAIGVTLIARWR